MGGGDIRDIHGDPKRGILDAGDIASVEPTLTLESPSLIDAIKVALPVPARGLSLAVDNKGRVVVFRRCWPLVRHIDLLRITHDYGTVVLESDGSSP